MLTAALVIAGSILALAAAVFVVVSRIVARLDLAAWQLKATVEELQRLNFEVEKLASKLASDSEKSRFP